MDLLEKVTFTIKLEFEKLRFFLSKSRCVGLQALTGKVIFSRSFCLVT